MTDPILQIYLPAFLLVATWLIVFWQQFRKVTRITETSADIEKVRDYNRLKKVSMYFWLIFSMFSLMTIIYSFAPKFYFMFIPLDKFHHPVINVMGLLIIKIAIIWIVIAQVHIDKELFKYSRNIRSLTAMELVQYSERILITGLLVLFIGFFVTITNIIGFLLVLLGALFYLRMYLINPPGQIQN